MDPALASLLGAFIGGSTVAASNFGLDALRAKRERADKESDELTEARRAARLIAEELESGRRLLSRDVEAKTHSWEPPARQLPTAAWTAYRTHLARFASQDAWETVAAAYAHFDELNWHVIAVIDEDHWTGAGPDDPLERRSMGPRTIDLFTAGLAAIDEALTRLRALMKREP